VLKQALGPLFGRVIDIHAHIYDPLPEPTDDALAKMTRLAARAGVGRLVLAANATGLLSDPDPSPGLVADINTYTLRATERHPDSILGFCYLNPANPASFIEQEMDRCLVEGGMRGIKLWVAVKCTDPRVDRVMDRAERLGLPVLHHAWYKATGPVHQESTPAEVAELGRRFPSVTLVTAHLGGGRERGVLDIADVPNVMVDTSGSQPEAGLIEYANRRLGARRIIFGTDWPIRDFGVQLGRVLGAEIEGKDKELILRGNAVRLLRLEDGDQ